MQAVLRGLTSREHALLTHHTLEADLDARKKALAELEAGTGGKPVFGGDKAKVRAREDAWHELFRTLQSIAVSVSGPLEGFFPAQTWSSMVWVETLSIHCKALLCRSICALFGL